MTPLDIALVHLDVALNPRYGDAPMPVGEYAIFGSTALHLRGIIEREPADVDVFVTRAVWGHLLAHPAWKVETPNAGDPPILSLKTPINLNLFFDWRDFQVEINVPRLLREAEVVEYEGHGRFLCARVEEILRHKEAALSYGSLAVQKHRPDIAAIREHLAVTA